MGAAYFLILFGVVHVLLAANVDEYRSYENYKLLLVESGMQSLKSIVEDMDGHGERIFYQGNRTATNVLVAPELSSHFYTILESKNIKSRLISDDYSKNILMEKARPYLEKGYSWTAYYDVNDIYNYLSNVSRSYPESTELIVGGRSYEGRKILGLRINTPNQRLEDKGKPVMFIESGIHAREWITPATTTYFINQLITSSDPEIVKMRDQFDWRIFPTVNPDGYHYSFTVDRMWRKTRSRSSNGCRGADPNRNWDYNWLNHGASSDPCNYQTYGGKNPFSEIETRSLSKYIASIENLQGYVAFHSDAQMLLVPYSDSSEHMDNYDDLVRIGKISLEYGYNVNNEKYDGPGTAAELLYKASGGSMDWVRNALGTSLVYTYELRGVYFQWPPSRIYEQGDEVTQMMLGLVNEANTLGYF